MFSTFCCVFMDSTCLCYFDLTQVGIAVSMLMYIQQAATPSMVRLGHISESDTFVELGSDPMAREIPNMLMVRWDENLFFGNIEVFKTAMDKEIMLFLERNCTEQKHWCLLLCCAAINDIDASAAEYLRLYFTSLNAKYSGMVITLCDVKQQVKQVMMKSKVIQEGDPSFTTPIPNAGVAQHHTFLNKQQAVKYWTDGSSTGNLSEV